MAWGDPGWHELTAAAHRAVTKARARGALVPQPCEVCGSTKRIDAHHEDYAKPLDVRWLCHRHHAQRHRAMLIEAVAHISTPPWSEIERAAAAIGVRPATFAKWRVARRIDPVRYKQLAHELDVPYLVLRPEALARQAA